MTIEYNSNREKFIEFLKDYANNQKYGWTLFSDDDDGGVGSKFDDLVDIFPYWGARLNGAHIHAYGRVRIVLSDNTFYDFCQLTETGYEVWQVLKSKNVDPIEMANILTHLPLVEEI